MKLEGRVSGIDIGSNTVRLLVADVDTEAICDVRRLQGISRLGGGFDPVSGLSDAAMERTVECLAAMIDKLGEDGLGAHVAMGTSALRRAANRDVFIDMAKRSVGVDVEVIDNETEGRLTARGAASAMAASGDFWLVDVGGGSTELGFFSGGVHLAGSVELGCISLLEAELHSDPPTPDELVRAQAAADSVLAGICSGLDCAAGAGQGALVAVAGTATTLAAMDLELLEYDADKINGHVLNDAALMRLQKMLGCVPAQGRIGMRGLERGREDLILPGILLLRAAMRALGRPEITVSDASLLEGVALAAADRYFGPKNRRFRSGGRLTIVGPFG